MFFLGILLSVEALNAAGLLQLLAAQLSEVVPDVNLVAAAIGLASAVIDNVSCCWQHPCPAEQCCTPPPAAAVCIALHHHHGGLPQTALS